MPIPEKTVRALDAALDKWVDGRGYLVPEDPSDAARRIGTTSALLSRYCREVKGMDFKTIRRNLRIEDAKGLLLAHPEYTSSFVGRQVGIRDRSNFLNQFRAVTGMTPEEWRQRNS